MRRAALLVSLLAFSACGNDRAGGLKPGAARAMNVLLVTIDTLRADRTGLHGYEAGTTPTLDRLAERGAQWTRAASPAPLTLPAHASLMTGLEPPHHGVRHNGSYRLGAGHPTLAERLREAGYRTGAVTGAYVVDSQYGLDRGFETYDDALQGNERRAAEVTDAGLRWLAQADDDRPFFLWLHYFDPHQPYDPPEPHRSRFDRRYDGEVAYTDAELGPVAPGPAVRRGRARLARRRRRHRAQPVSRVRPPRPGALGPAGARADSRAGRRSRSARRAVTAAGGQSSAPSG